MQRANHPLIIGTNNTERMRIASTGNVGIGTTSPPYKLTVEDGTGATRVNVRNTANAGPGSGIFFEVFSGGSVVGNGTIATQSSGDMAFFTGTSSGTERMRIASTGNVGIGTSSPSRLLEVNGSAAFINIDSGANNNQRGIEFDYGGLQINGSLINFGGTGETALSSGESGSSGYFLTFKTNGSEHMRIDSSGITTLTAFKPDKYQPVYGPSTVTGGFVNGAAVNTWHAITNVDINGYLGGYTSGQKGLIIEIFWTSGNTSLGYNHAVSLAIPATGSNTFSGYSSGNFSSFQISGNHYDELPSTTVHHTSLTATHNIRFRLRNTTGVSYDPLRLEINASTAPNAYNAYITIWRA